MFWLTNLLLEPHYPREIARARAARTEAFRWVFSGIWRGIKAVFHGFAVLGEKYRRQRLLNATIRDLSRMDNHLLRDLGMSRGDIRTVAEGLVYGKPKAYTAEQSSARPRTEQTSAAQNTGQHRADDNWRRAA